MTRAALIHGQAFLPTLFVMLLAGNAAAADVILDMAAFEKVDAEAQRLIDEQRAPGIAIGIMSQGKIVYAKGFGWANLETGTKVTPDSVFLIGSITKQFTAAAIMQLAEQGKLRIDDPISLYFPDFPRGNEVTIRQLLTHTSGIHPIMSAGAPPTPEQAVKLRSTKDVIELIQGIPNLYDFEPGTSFRYSNSGYWLLGAIVESVSGVSLGDYFKQNLFDRAGMTATALDEPTEIVPHRVSGYNRMPGADGFTNPRHPYISVRGGAGGIRSTVGDMLRWQDALLAGRIISSDGVKAMTTPGTTKTGGELPTDPLNARQYGFGLSLGNQNGHPFFGHTGGSTQGFNASLKVFPDDRVAFVVLTNVGGNPRGMAPNQGRRIRKPGSQPPGEGPRQIRGGGVALELDRFLSELITGTRQAEPQ